MKDRLIINSRRLALETANLQWMEVENYLFVRTLMGLALAVANEWISIREIVFKNFRVNHVVKFELNFSFLCKIQSEKS